MELETVEAYEVAIMEFDQLWAKPRQAKVTKRMEDLLCAIQKWEASASRLEMNNSYFTEKEKSY